MLPFLQYKQFKILTDETYIKLLSNEQVYHIAGADGYRRRTAPPLVKIDNRIYRKWMHRLERLSLMI
jgi:hypothetical protein